MMSMISIKICCPECKISSYPCKFHGYEYSLSCTHKAIFCAPANEFSIFVDIDIVIDAVI